MLGVQMDLWGLLGREGQGRAEEGDRKFHGVIV
jgi:hypothetical protein